MTWILHGTTQAQTSLFPSCDNVLFKVQRRNLESYSQGFSAEQTISFSHEVIQLTETSSVLELLLRYMKNEPQPDPDDVEFEVLAGLAEAAEKFLLRKFAKCT